MKSGYTGCKIGTAWAKRTGRLVADVASDNSFLPPAEFRRSPAPNDQRKNYLTRPQRNAKSERRQAAPQLLPALFLSAGGRSRPIPRGPRTPYPLDRGAG